MPRKTRIDAPGALHHIIIRGIERRKIFLDDRDRDDFIDRLSRILKQSSTTCYAWVLIPNHVHLLLRTGTTPIPTVMRRLLTGYVVNFNRRYGRHGPLFQNRYKSILCQEDPYFLKLVRYIHLNPLRSLIVKSYSELGGYRYAGHGVILGRRKNDWQDVDQVLGFFGTKAGRARNRYEAYVEEATEQGRRPELVGGGLIRSMGGWSEARRRQRVERRMKGDERILGDSGFVLEVLRVSEERLERKYRLKSQGYDVERLARYVGSLFEMEPEEILSPGKYRQAVKARSVFCYWAVRELGESATALARRLGLTQPAVSISVKRGETIIKGMKLSPNFII
jgi:REP element-mobilizing transposase RayT